MMNLLDGAEDDLAEGIDERLEDVTGMQRAEHSTPQEQTVDKLPVIHRLIRFLQRTDQHSCDTTEILTNITRSEHKS